MNCSSLYGKPLLSADRSCTTMPFLCSSLSAPKDTAANWPPRFLKLLLHFGPQPDRAESKSCQLAYCDARRFGRIKLVQGEVVAVFLGRQAGYIL